MERIPCSYLIPKSVDRYTKNISTNQSREIIKTDGALFYALATGQHNALYELYEYLVRYLERNNKGINAEMEEYCKSLFEIAFGKYKSDEL